MSTPWRVDAAAALEAWERRDRPSPERALALMEWFFACAESEPPRPDGVPEVDVVVTYYVVVYERLMLVKEIEDT